MSKQGEKFDVDKSYNLLSILDKQLYVNKKAALEAFFRGCKTLVLKRKSAKKPRGFAVSYLKLEGISKVICKRFGAVTPTRFSLSKWTFTKKD